MSYAARQNSSQNELWNVSLLPARRAPARPDPSPGPIPGGGGAAGQLPALLSLCDAVNGFAEAEAA